MTDLTKLISAGMVTMALGITGAVAQDKVTFATNWLAQAEHGGYYQAVADGTYAKYGLDVTIAPGRTAIARPPAAGLGPGAVLHGRRHRRRSTASRKASRPLRSPRCSRRIRRS